MHDLTVHECYMFTLFPIFNDNGKACSGPQNTVSNAVFSPIFVFYPTRIGWDSPWATLPKPKYESLPTNTEPIIVALGATYAVLAITGCRS